jgi:hypothetical protein
LTASQTYVLDANVFIEAAKRYYAFDIVPSFWQMLVAHAESEQLLSIDRVKDELLRADLAMWAKGTFHEFFASTSDQDVIAAYREVMSWSQDQTQFTEAAKAQFAGVADGWLISYALAKGCVVVTHEQFDPNIKRKVKIPNACRAFDIACVDTFQMMRALGIRLG